MINGRLEQGQAFRNELKFEYKKTWSDIISRTLIINIILYVLRLIRAVYCAV